MDAESRELIARVSRGDGAALEDLLARHLSGLRAYVRLRAGRDIRARESASDLVQSACREVLERLDPQALPDPVAFRRWLYRAALRKVIDRARYHGAERRDPGREADVGGGTDRDGWAGVYASVASPSTEAMSREAVVRIEDAFDALDEDQREVILLSRVVRLPHAEIAKALGRTEQATRSLLSRALARLAGILDRGERRDGDP